MGRARLAAGAGGGGATTTFFFLCVDASDGAGDASDSRRFASASAAGFTFFATMDVAAVEASVAGVPLVEADCAAGFGARPVGLRAIMRLAPAST